MGERDRGRPPAMLSAGVLIALGAAVGVLVGALLGHRALWTAAGIGIGLAAAIFLALNG